MTRLPLICVSLLAVLLLPGWVTAAALNDTGITWCADATQNNLPCPQAGFPNQDAETGRDAQQTAGTLGKIGGGSAGFDFTKLDASGNPLPADATSWDCVRDNVTGLIWEIKTDDSGLRDKNWTYTWCNNNSATNGGNAGTCDTGAGVGSDNCLNNARCDTEKYVADVNALSPALCGYTDWRLPTVDELHNIVDHSRENPAIDADYFPRTVSYVFRSASPLPPSLPVGTWSVSFSYGSDGPSLSEGKTEYVRLVRGGPSLALETTPTSDFTLDDVNGTAYHQKTGLTWKRCAEGQSWDSANKTCTGTATHYPWSAALSLASGGWRLPNINELRSIVERRNFDPPINATVFPNTSSYWFWSSSPGAYYPGGAWNVEFYVGFIEASYKDYHNAVRLVRGGEQYALLSVLKTGTGNGTVGGGGTFPYNTTVTPTATAATGSTFTGWNPPSCGAPFALTADTTCTATFTLNTYTLTVAKTGTGSGTVGGGGTFPYNTTVSPTATAATGSTFTGWNPPSCGTPFTLTVDTTCTATFTLNNYTLTVNQTGTGSGTVGGGGTFPYNTTVTPTATAATGSTFTGWTPTSCGTPFALTADTTCTATFTLNT